MNSNWRLITIIWSVLSVIYMILWSTLANPSIPPVTQWDMLAVAIIAGALITVGIGIGGFVYTVCHNLSLDKAYEMWVDAMESSVKWFSHAIARLAFAWFNWVWIRKFKNSKVEWYYQDYEGHQIACRIGYRWFFPKDGHTLMMAKVLDIPTDIKTDPQWETCETPVEKREELLALLPEGTQLGQCYRLKD